MGSIQHREVTSLCTSGRDKCHLHMEVGVHEVVRPCVQRTRTYGFNDFCSHPWVLLAVGNEPLPDRLCNLLGKYIAKENKRGMGDVVLMSTFMMLRSLCTWKDRVHEPKPSTRAIRARVMIEFCIGAEQLRGNGCMGSASHKLEYRKSHFISGPLLVA